MTRNPAKERLWELGLEARRAEHERIAALNMTEMIDELKHAESMLVKILERLDERITFLEEASCEKK
jgi:hypothetical protein